MQQSGIDKPYKTKKNKRFLRKSLVFLSDTPEGKADHQPLAHLIGYTAQRNRVFEYP